jgi:hypothetical protein
MAYSALVIPASRTAASSSSAGRRADDEARQEERQGRRGVLGVVLAALVE